jgi:hypothetical protein
VLLTAAPEDVFTHCLPDVRECVPRPRVAQVEDGPESRARALAQWAGR